MSLFVIALGLLITEQVVYGHMSKLSPAARAASTAAAAAAAASATPTAADPVPSSAVSEASDFEIVDTPS